MNYRSLSVFVHQQLVRYLTDANLRIPTKDFSQYIEILMKTDDLHNENIKPKLLPAYQQLIVRCGKRLQRSNVESLFRYVGMDDFLTSEAGVTSRVSSVTTPNVVPSTPGRLDSPLNSASNRFFQPSTPSPSSSTSSNTSPFPVSPPMTLEQSRQ